MSKMRLRIGTRGSDLALWQAGFIKEKLAQNGCETEQKILKTSGDKIQDVSFTQMEGQGFFTKEIEESLLAKEIDLAVHSLKDLMTSMPDGLAMGAVGFRADRRELLLISPKSYLRGGIIPIKDGATIGTSSARRQCQIAYHAPSMEIKELRGNVPTRVNKLRDGDYDAIIVAAAGVKRLQLDLAGLEVIHLAAEIFLPAPAQGILGLQIRKDDSETAKIVGKLNSQDAVNQVGLERGLLAKFDSGCSLPLGVCSDIGRDGFRLRALLGRPGENGWNKPAIADVTGDSVSAIVEETYKTLCEAD